MLHVACTVALKLTRFVLATKRERESSGQNKAKDFVFSSLLHSNSVSFYLQLNHFLTHNLKSDRCEYNNNDLELSDV